MRLILSLFFSLFFAVAARSDDDTKLFLKYFREYQRLSHGDTTDNIDAPAPQSNIKAVETPKWFRDLCIKKGLKDFAKPQLSVAELEKVFETFALALNYSGHAVIAKYAFKVARYDLEHSFDYILSIVTSFRKELDFDLKPIRDEIALWEKKANTMPEVKREEYIKDGKRYTLVFRSELIKQEEDSLLFSISGYDSENKLVFSDGPRIYDTEYVEGKVFLWSSFLTTWTDPAHRGSGLYQAALKMYLNHQKVDILHLYSENEETIEFLYETKDRVSQKSFRQRYIEVPAIREYLKVQGVKPTDFVLGKAKAIEHAMTALLYLSLQGRTRLKMGWSFDPDEENFSTDLSKELTSVERTKILKALETLETSLKTELKTNGPHAETISKLFPQSYLGILRKSKDKVPERPVFTESTIVTKELPSEVTPEKKSTAPICKQAHAS